MTSNKKNIYRHGELLLKEVSSLPTGAELKNTTKKHIVAHSETGHHHTLVADKDFKIYSHSGTSFIEIPSIAELQHEKTGKDVHKTHTITPAIYEVIIKKEFDYFQGALRAVRD